jgi:rod shape determining protein RodA
VLLGIYLLLIMRIVAIAERQRSVFSRCYAYGVASVIFFHIAINICMTIGLAPVIGIPLPFLSYGGTALLTFTMLLFILIRLDADRQMVLR